MKKYIMLCLLLFLLTTLSSCNMINKDDVNDVIDDGTNNPNDQKEDHSGKDDSSENNYCDSLDNYIIVDDQCIPIPDIVSGNIEINGDETIVNYMNSVQLYTDFVADLSDSTGLAVVSRDVFESNNDESVNLAGEEDEETENLIVKLNNEGFFEEVSFTDDSGFSVEIESNPLALEIFGEFTVVAFEVDFGSYNETEDFTQKLYDSLYAGGIYLIHNETGKLFATKQVDYTENEYTKTEDFSRTSTIQVTLGQPVIEMLGQPVVDDNGNFVLNEDGSKKIEIIENPLRDSDGNPLIFNEGPIKMEKTEVLVTEWITKPKLDEDGNPMLDEDGNELFEEVEVTVLDKDGNPLYDTITEPILDEDGNPLFEETFEVEIFIEDIRDITIIDYNASIIDNPLSELAQRFVDKIISEYYNWNYYRISDYQIDSNGFVYNDNGIFYTSFADTEDSSVRSQILKKVSFDDTTLEVMIENFLDITKAGFDEGDLMIDPLNNTVIYNSWGGNIKIFSESQGLITIPDSDTLQPVTFPNGELFFYNYQEEYVNELGYSTTALYHILEDGTLDANYIELGERNEMCYGECINSISIDLYRNTSELYYENSNLTIQLHNGEPVYHKADMVLQHIDDFDASRSICTDPAGCWYNTIYEIYDTNENLLTTLHTSGKYYEEDTPPNYIERYTIDESTDVEYQTHHVPHDVVCENEIGCTNTINLQDENINENGLWLNDTVILSQGDQFLETIQIPKEAAISYDYEKTLSSEVCTYSTCTEWITVRFYDIDGSLLYENNAELTYSNGELIPLHIDYHITDNTSIVYREEVCTSSNGCNEWYNTDSVGYEIQYDQDDVIYDSITFADSDITTIYEETITRDVCMNVEGCWDNDVVYTILDNDGNLIYEFTGNPHITYGYKAPFSATVSLSECITSYKKEYVLEDMLCSDGDCSNDIQIYLDDMNEAIGWSRITYNEGDKIISRINIDSNNNISNVNQNVCLEENGCIVYTNNFTVLDEDGNEVSLYTQDDWQQNLPVEFSYGDLLPNDESFHATFVLREKEYRTQRINIHNFIYQMNNTIMLDENLYLIERDSWQQGDDNFILSFNEDTNRYSIKYTNISAVLEITEFHNGYIAINKDETAIIQFNYNEDNSSENYYFFEQENLTEGLLINGVNDLIIDYDGSIYFKGVDNFIQDITGSISEDGTIVIDVEYVEPTLIRVRPIN